LVALLIGAPLVLQGISLVTQERPGRRLGILNLLLAGLGFVYLSMMTTGVVVPGREFGVVMVEGSWGRAGLFVMLIGLSVAAGLCLHVVGTAAGSRIRLEWMLLLGVVIGLAASSCVSSLDDSAPIPLRVYEYDLWWPVWLGWMAVCLFGSGLAIFKVVQARHWLLFYLGMSSLLAIVAVERSRLRFSYAHDTTLTLWRVVLYLAFPALLAMSVGSLRVPRLIDRKEWRRAITAAVFVLALAACLGWVYDKALLFVYGFGALVAVLAIIAIVDTGVPLFKTWRAAGYAIHDVGRPGRWDDIVALSALLAIIAAIIDLIYYGAFPPLLTFAMLVLAWLVIVEVATGSLLQRANPEGSTLSPLAHASRGAATALRDFASGSLQRIQKYFQADSWPAAAIKTLFAVLAGVVILVAGAELPNAGKTTVTPFSVTLPNDPAAKNDELEKKLALVIPVRVLSALGLLRSELRTEVMTLSPMSDTKAKNGTRIDTASASPAGWEAVLAKGSDLKVGGVEIPLTVLAAPVQSIMRSILAERVISGSFYAGQNAVTLHAASSEGDYWRAELPAMEHEHPALPASPPVKNDPLEAASALAEQIAFQMISRDPAMSSAGMTDSWAALQDFRLGLADWRRYEAGSPDQLTNAIEHFQRAIEKDQNFALAYYRLGLAYNDDGQPARAVKQLQASINVRPDFAVGYNALAYTLHNFDDYRPSPEALATAPFSSDAERELRAADAGKLWQRVLLLPAERVPCNERFSAYYGLCDLALGRGDNHLAYFLARRAEQAYATLSADLQAQATIRDNLANVADVIGVAVAATDTESIVRDFSVVGDFSDARDFSDWRCWGGEIVSVAWQHDHWVVRRSRMSSPYDRAAVRYYDQALALMPDDPIIQCNAALVRASLGDATMMEKLARDPAAHVRLADSLRKEGKLRRRETDGYYGYYALALREYKAALDLDSTNLDALQGYAYTFWVWRVRAAEAKPPYGPGPAEAHDAERYARRLLRLTHGNVTPSQAASYQSTLGVVLLGQGRIQEAVQVLEEACKLAPKSTQYDEIRYYLAQAYLEAATSKIDLGLTAEESAESKGVALLAEIRDKEKQQEDFAYSEIELLDSRPLLACSRTPETSVERLPDTRSPHYQMQISYRTVAPCGWTSVDSEVTNAKPEERFKLHVWGGGIDRRKKTQRDPPFFEPIVLETSQTVYSGSYYFAQLEDTKGEPLSAVDAIEVFPNDANDPCRRNGIHLTYRLVGE